VNEIVFAVTQDAEGGCSAECLTESIFTQGDTWDEVRANAKEAVEVSISTSPNPRAFGFTSSATKCSLSDENLAEQPIYYRFWRGPILGQSASHVWTSFAWCLFFEFGS
jgi:hypothetical protein